MSVFILYDVRTGYDETSKADVALFEDALAYLKDCGRRGEYAFVTAKVYDDDTMKLLGSELLVSTSEVGRLYGVSVQCDDTDPTSEYDGTRYTYLELRVFPTPGGKVHNEQYEDVREAQERAQVYRTLGLSYEIAFVVSRLSDDKVLSRDVIEAHPVIPY